MDRFDYTSIYEPRDYSNFGSGLNNLGTELVVDQEMTSNIAAEDILMMSPSQKLRDILEDRTEEIMAFPRIAEIEESISSTKIAKARYILAEKLREYSGLLRPGYFKTIYGVLLKAVNQNLVTVGVVFLSVTFLAIAFLPLPTPKRARTGTIYYLPSIIVTTTITTARLSK